METEIFSVMHPTNLATQISKSKNIFAFGNNMAIFTLGTSERVYEFDKTFKKMGIHFGIGTEKDAEMPSFPSFPMILDLDVTNKKYVRLAQRFTTVMKKLTEISKKEGMSKDLEEEHQKETIRWDNAAMDIFFYNAVLQGGFKAQEFNYLPDNQHIGIVYFIGDQDSHEIHQKSMEYIRKWFKS